MDGFKYITMLQALETEPQHIQLSAFEEALLTFGKEELDEIFSKLSAQLTKQHNVDKAKHITAMLQAIWHYR